MELQLPQLPAAPRGDPPGPRPNAVVDHRQRQRRRLGALQRVAGHPAAARVVSAPAAGARGPRHGHLRHPRRRFAGRSHDRARGAARAHRAVGHLLHPGGLRRPHHRLPAAERPVPLQGRQLARGGARRGALLHPEGGRAALHRGAPQERGAAVLAPPAQPHSREQHRGPGGGHRHRPEPVLRAGPGRDRAARAALHGGGRLPARRRHGLDRQRVGVRGHQRQAGAGHGPPEPVGGGRHGRDPGVAGLPAQDRHPHQQHQPDTRRGVGTSTRPSSRRASRSRTMAWTSRCRGFQAPAR